MKKLLLFAFAIFFFSGVMAQFTVTMNVDMNDVEGFDPATTDIYVSGSIFDWPQPGTNEDLLLLPSSEDPLIYTITATMAEAGEIQYKYFMVMDEPSWDNGEWTGDPNRTVYVTGETTLNDTWGVTPLSVTFMVDVSNTFEAVPDTTEIYMAGTINYANNWNQPGTDPSLMMMPSETDPLVYELTLLLPPGEYQYKYFLVNNGEASWDNGEWTGDPNRVVTIDSLNTEISDTWGSAAAINDPAAGPISAIYPNPCTSQINVTFFENLNEINKVEIYNIIGEVVQTVEGFRSQQITINTADLTNGVYIIAVHNKQGVQTSKFVKE